MAQTVATETALEVSVLASDLAQALAVVKPAIPSASKAGYAPVILNVLLETTESGLLVTATDQALALRATCPGELIGAGCIRTTVLQSKLSGWVAAQPRNARVTLAVSGTGVTLNCGRDRVRLSTIDADQFPRLPEASHQITDVPAEFLKRALKLVAASAAREESRPVLAGVNWLLGGDTLTLAASDGSRLGRARLTLAQPVYLPTSLIVDAGAMFALSPMLDAAGAGNVAVLLDDIELPNRILFRAGGSMLVSSLIDGTFPDYERIIPADPTTIVVVDARELDRQLQVVHLAETEITGDRTTGGKFKVSVAMVSIQAPDTIVVRGHNDLVDHEGAIDAEITGSGLDIGLDGSILRDILKGLGADQVQIGLTSPLSPIKITALDSDGLGRGDTEVAILMPMHIERSAGWGN